MCPTQTSGIAQEPFESFGNGRRVERASDPSIYLMLDELRQRSGRTDDRWNSSALGFDNGNAEAFTLLRLRRTAVNSGGAEWRRGAVLLPLPARRIVGA